MPVSFEVKPGDRVTILAIADRAVKLAAKYDALYPKLELVMDLTACHASGCELALPELLAAGDGDFAHDVFGISRHLNRKTGQLGQCFMPRYARANHAN